MRSPSLPHATPNPAVQDKLEASLKEQKSEAERLSTELASTVEAAKAAEVGAEGEAA